jgi:hypothetical protein
VDKFVQKYRYFGDEDDWSYCYMLSGSITKMLENPPKEFILKIPIYDDYMSDIVEDLEWDQAKLDEKLELIKTKPYNCGCCTYFATAEEAAACPDCDYDDPYIAITKIHP